MPVTKTRLLVFAKAPVAGQVKTRLIPAMGEQHAADLYAELIEKTLRTVGQLARQDDGVEVELWCAPDDHHPFLRACSERYGIPTKVQVGNDLGERMAFATNKTIEESRIAIVMGTDCPGYTPEYISDAIRCLHEGNEVVLGPAYDGGYVLLGLKNVCPHLFENMPWGTDQVLDMARQRIRQQALRCAELSGKHDLDRPADLEFFPELKKRFYNEMAG